MSNYLTREIGRFGAMTGADLKAWRTAQGYSQENLMRELGIRSRQTLSKWENGNGDIPRDIALAIVALEFVPSCRRFCGKQISERERRQYAARGKR